MAERIAISCPQCGKVIHATPEMLGRKGRCRDCKHAFVVQRPSAPLAAAPKKEEVDEYELAPLSVSAPVEIVPARPLKPTSTQPVSKPASKPAPSARDKSMMPLLAAIAGSSLVAILTCCGGFAAVSYWGGGDSSSTSSSATPRAGSSVSPDGTVNLVRQPAPGKYSHLPLHPLQAAKDWSVTAEEIAPAPEGLRSAIPVPYHPAVATHFSAPSAGRFAIVTSVQVANEAGERRWPLEWTQYDLRQLDPIRSVKIGDHDQEFKHRSAVDPRTPYDSRSPIVSALSGGGELLAYAYPDRANLIRVHAAEGESVAQFEVPDLAPDKLLQGLWFCGDDRLLVLTSRSLKGYEIPSGKELYSLPQEEAMRPSLSRGGKWMVLFLGDRFKWYSTRDGSPAGEIVLPEYWQNSERNKQSLVAFHPNGKWFATFVSSVEVKRAPLTADPNYSSYEDPGHFLVATWDMATGKPREQYTWGYHFSDKALLPNEGHWAGDRRLVLHSGHMFDLDKHTFTGLVKFSTYQPGWAGFDVPDSRIWTLRQATAEEKPKLEALTGRAHEPGCYLVAGTVPPPKLVEQLAKFEKSFLFHPGFRVSIALIDDSIPPEHRDQLLSDVADALARSGCTVDPKSKFRFEISKAAQQVVPNPARALGLDISMSPDAPKGKVYATQMLIDLVEGGRDNLLPYNYGLSHMAEGTPDTCWKALGQQTKKNGFMFPPLIWYLDELKQAPFRGQPEADLAIDGIE
jgi:hypothetical protein